VTAAPRPMQGSVGNVQRWLALSVPTRLKMRELKHRKAVWSTSMLSIALGDRCTQESCKLEAQRAYQATLQNYFEQRPGFLHPDPAQRFKRY
jgi:hypothetical protein